MSPDTLALLLFPTAAERWLWQHSQYIEPRTVNDYKQYIKTLTTFFGGLRLNQIQIGHIRVYQRSRAARAKSSRINMEMSTLQQVLKNANLWHKIAPLYRPLPTRKEGSGRPYSKEERDKLLSTALGKNTRWHLAGHSLRIMFNTGMGFGELRCVRRCDVNVEERTMWVLLGAKNQDRRRLIPLNDEAFASMKWIIERWKKTGGSKPEDYLLYHRAHQLHSEPDFSQHIGSIKTAFYAIRKKAGLPTKAWEGPRIYDCRVTAITETLSSGDVSLHTAEKLYGHVGKAMQKRYYKPDLDVMKAATDRLAMKKEAQTVVAKMRWSWISTTNS